MSKKRLQFNDNDWRDILTALYNSIQAGREALKGALSERIAFQMNGQIKSWESLMKQIEERLEDE